MVSRHCAPRCDPIRQDSDEFAIETLLPQVGLEILVQLPNGLCREALHRPENSPADAAEGRSQAHAQDQTHCSEIAPAPSVSALRNRFSARRAGATKRRFDAASCAKPPRRRSFGKNRDSLHALEKRSGGHAATCHHTQERNAATQEPHERVGSEHGFCLCLRFIQLAQSRAMRSRSVGGFGPFEDACGPILLQRAANEPRSHSNRTKNDGARSCHRTRLTDRPFSCRRVLELRKRAHHENARRAPLHAALCHTSSIGPNWAGCGRCSGISPPERSPAGGGIVNPIREIERLDAGMATSRTGPRIRLDFLPPIPRKYRSLSPRSRSRGREREPGLCGSGVGAPGTRRATSRTERKPRLYFPDPEGRPIR